MTAFAMSDGQRERWRLGEIERMDLGVFRCVEGLSGAEDDCSNDALWEAPLEDWHEARCWNCMRPALLVERVPRAELNPPSARRRD